MDNKETVCQKGEIMDNLILMTAHHKKDDFIPISMKYFFPIHVGKSISDTDLEIHGDDDGDNISGKNKNFCELTAYYWAWKNSQADYIGLMHYRRIFTSQKYLIQQIVNNVKYTIKNILCCLNLYKFCLSISNFRLVKKTITNDEAKALYNELKLLVENDKFDIILPKKVKFRFQSLKDNFILHHNYDDWYLFKKITITKYPFLNEAFNETESINEFYAFNMFIMKRKIYNEYMEMMFDILFTMEKEIDFKHKNDYQKRLFGFLSERLLNIYLIYKKKNEELKIKELNVIFSN